MALTKEEDEFGNICDKLTCYVLSVLKSAGHQKAEIRLKTRFVQYKTLLLYCPLSTNAFHSFSFLFHFFLLLVFHFCLHFPSFFLSFFIKPHGRMQSKSICSIGSDKHKWHMGKVPVEDSAGSELVWEQSTRCTSLVLLKDPWVTVISCPLFSTVPICPKSVHLPWFFLPCLSLGLLSSECVPRSQCLLQVSAQWSS